MSLAIKRQISYLCCLAVQAKEVPPPFQYLIILLVFDSLVFDYSITLE